LAKQISNNRTAIEDEFDKNEDFDPANYTIPRDGMHNMLTKHLGLMPFITNNIVNFLKECYNPQRQALLSLKGFV
jgi:hypothetical protein